jgi:hypothetical protein
VPWALRSSSHASVFGCFDNFEHEFRPH